MIIKAYLQFRRRHPAILAEQGASLVEMAFACLILIPMLLGIIQLSIGLYCYHYAADAAREASRWAIVRGSTCSGLFNLAYCSPTSGNSSGADNGDISHYVRSLGYPFSGNLSTTTQWCVNSQTIPATWSCSTTQNATPLNQISVKVTYSYPLIIPFLKKNTLNIASVSNMTIVQ